MWAAVRIRLPSMITPEPEVSWAVALAQGRTKSGSRRVAWILTTESPMGSLASAGDASRDRANTIQNDLRIVNLLVPRAGQVPLLL